MNPAIITLSLWLTSSRVEIFASVAGRDAPTESRATAKKAVSA
jgi:hypothetical protein